MKVSDLIALIENDGWVEVRMKGSHRQFHHPTKPGTVTVAGKPSVDVPPGTLNSALKQAGLNDVKVSVGARRAGDPFTVLIASGAKPAHGTRNPVAVRGSQPSRLRSARS